MDAINIDDTLKEYFYSGRAYKTILHRLSVVHGVDKSLSWLKRRLKSLGLKRRGADPPEETLEALVQSVLDSSNRLRGYRAVWRILRKKYKLTVRRDTVMRIMRRIDPEGVQCRRRNRLKRRLYRSKGPNYIWHMDGYDKLSPYGFCIHGCIDGFSRKLIWLKLSTTNHDPKVIARYYLESLEKCKGCPRIVRADHGTENALVAEMQIAFRFSHTDSLAGPKSFLYGPSTANIRIEAWWSQLRRFKTNWWIELCKDLQYEGHYDHTNVIHRYTLRFVLGTLLQQDLDDFVADWNSHHIRKNRNVDSPSGCPEDIYDMPMRHGAHDHLQPFDIDLWLMCMSRKSRIPPRLYPEEFERCAVDILDRALDLNPRDVSHENCRNIYVKLLRIIEACINSGISYSTLGIDSEEVESE